MNSDPPLPNGRPPSTVRADLVAGIDGVIAHALDIVGRHIRGRLPRAERKHASGIRPDTLHTTDLRLHVDEQKLLDNDVWVRVPEIAHRYSIDAASLVRALDDYVRELITTGERYDYRHIPAILKQAGLLRGTD